MVDGREDGTEAGTGALLRRPSGFLPVLMSVGALGVVLGSLALHGVVRGGDESTAAHLWQLLMGLQVPVVGYFALRWVPRSPRRALPVLAVQVLAALAAAAPVFLLGL
jgi:hypothetical protein